MELVIRNYRTFSAGHPLKFTVEDGVTAIVGPNNSGKSFVLKSFYELRPFYQSLIDPNRLLNIMKGDELKTSFFGPAHPGEVFHEFNNEPIKFALQKGSKKFVFDIFRNPPRIVQGNLYIGEEEIGPHLRGHKLDGEKSLFQTSTGREIDVTEFLNFFRSSTNSIYIPAFRNAVNIGASNSYYDIDIGEAFIQNLHGLSANDDPSVRRSFLDVQEDLRNLFGYKTFEIKESTGQRKIFLAINGSSRLLSDLGAGITQFILVFVQAAVKNPDFILIDEPELNLHPKLQIDFVNRLLKYTKRGMIFATHNLGLAHATAERIYTTYKVGDDKESVIIPFEETPKFAEFLGELNFSNFVNFGFKKVLLVEGTTDVKVFSIFLRKLRKYRDVLVLPRGGESLINENTAQELSELKRLGKEVKIIGWVDSEKKSQTGKVKASRTGFQKECKKIGIKIIISDRRSIENYFPKTSVQKVNPKAKQLKPYDTVPKGVWRKGENWKMAQEINLEDLKDTDLYKFLKKI